MYEFFRGAVDWPELLRPGQRFALDARVRSCTDIPSAMLVQQRGRDAICDAVRDARWLFAVSETLMPVVQRKIGDFT